MKLELEQQYEAWQDIIDNEEANVFSENEFCESVQLNKKNLEDKIEKAHAKFLSEDNEIEKSFAPLKEELDQFKVELDQKYNNFLIQIYRQISQRINEIDFDDSDDEQQGLNFQTFQQFETFQADESHVGNQCSICMEDV